MIYSFDLFDTLITRRFYDPKDVFLAIGRIAKRIGLINPTCNFSKVRIESEKKARKTSRAEEVSIGEIYEVVKGKLVLTNNQIKKLIDLELRVEFKNFVVIKKHLDLLIRAERKVVITDTYFEKWFVEKILREKLDLNNIEVFVSSEVKKTKKNGTLFKHCLEKLKIFPHQLLHTGDNFISDYKVPQGLGIKVNYVPMVKWNQIDNIRKDIKSSLFWGVSKYAQLECKSKDLALAKVSNFVIGPTLFLFVFQLLKDASQKKLQRVFFLSRDGQLLFKIAKIIQRKYFKEIDCKYLFASRKAWHLAGICDQIDDFTFEWLFYNQDNLTLEKVFGRLELNSSDFVLELKRFGINCSESKILAPSEICLLKKCFRESNILQKEIFEKSRQKRLLLIDYIKQECVLEFPSVGIVDVGWNGRLQYSLSRIFSYEGLANEIHGFYFFLFQKKSFSDRSFLHSFLEKTPKISIPVFESFVYADHGTLISYERANGRIKPVLDNGGWDGKSSWWVERQQFFVLSFAEKLLDSMPCIDILKLKEEVVCNLESFFGYPDNSAVLLYSNLFHDDEQLLKSKVSVIPKITYFDLFAYKFFRWNKFRGIWWGAALKKNFPFLSNCLKIKRKLDFYLLKAFGKNEF